MESKIRIHLKIEVNEEENNLADDKFTTSNTKYSLQTVELTVIDLGFPDGATTAPLFKRASELGLELCPLELGPQLRLGYLEQLEGYLGNASQQHQAKKSKYLKTKKLEEYLPAYELLSI